MIKKIRQLQFSLDVVKTLAIHYFMLLECMCEVLKLLTTQNPKKILKIELKKGLNTEFPMLREHLTTFFITVNKYFLPLQSNFFVTMKAVLHFIS